MDQAQGHPDPTYLEQWDANVEQLLERLERDDRHQINDVAGAAQLRTILSKLVADDDERRIRPSLMLILPSLEHFEKFGNSLTSAFGSHPSPRALWGILVLVVKLVVGSPDAIRQIGVMIKRLGQKMEIFNEYYGSGTRPKQMKEAAVDVHVELITYFVAAIRFLREEASIFRYSSKHHHEDPWAPLLRDYTLALRNIEDIFSRIERLYHLARRKAVQEDLKEQQLVLNLTSGSSAKESKLPCIKLPSVRNRIFYDRDNILSQVNAYFFPDSGERTLRSIVLYGVGGVGKSHAALKYCEQKVLARSLDVIVWIEAETPVSLAQSFTDFALLLELPGVGRDRHEENRIIVLSWLQQTEARWLLIFDNGEDPDLLLRYWPPPCHSGSILVTSRNHNIQYGPADFGIEVPSFDAQDGSRLLLNLLRMDIISDISNLEVESALGLSEQMSGHALALSFIAGLIQRRSWSIQEFLLYYERQRDHIHGSTRSNALSVIWKISFESLEHDSASLLGVLSYLNADCIEECLVRSTSLSTLPMLPSDHDIDDVYDALEPLLTMALVKRDKNGQTLSLHRLVQTQYRYFINHNDRQKAFDGAVKLVFNAFPRVAGQLYDKWEQCQANLQHVLILKGNYEKERSGPKPLKPTMQFCWLLGNCARFLVEIADYVELGHVLTVARNAFQELQETDRNYDVYSKTIDSLGLYWSHRGYFKRGEPFVQEAYKIRLERTEPIWFDIGWVENDMALQMVSFGKYEEALEFGLRAVNAFDKVQMQDAIKSRSVVLRNLGRCYMFCGQTEKAAGIFRETMEILLSSENWAAVTLSYLAWGYLERKRKDFALAKDMYTKAQEAWLRGAKMKTHHINAACTYKLGCVADDLGNTDEAIKHLREAMVIAKLKENVLQGDYARILHKLATVLRKRQVQDPDAALLDAEARRILKVMTEENLDVSPSQGSCSVQSSVSDKSVAVAIGVEDQAGAEEVYDSLVYCLWR